MASDSDELNVRLIEDFTPRLRELVKVDQVLIYLHSIEADQKERILKKAENDGSQAAVDLLLTAVTKKPHAPGWFRAFVDALEQSGCQYAADYMQLNIPEPEVEKENYYSVKLIQLLAPSLMDMKTEVVRVQCLSAELLTVQDAEIVSNNNTVVLTIFH